MQILRSELVLLLTHFAATHVAKLPCRMPHNIVCFSGRDTSSVLTGYYFCFLLWMDFKLSISLFHLDLTYNPTHHPKYIHRMSISGIYNCWTYKWKPTKLSQYSPWRDPLHWCFDTHTKSYMHTPSPSLHAVPHLQGAKVREHRLMLNDLLHTHCSTIGTVFVATLDDFLL